MTFTKQQCCIYTEGPNHCKQRRNGEQRKYKNGHVTAAFVCINVSSLLDKRFSADRFSMFVGLMNTSSMVLVWKISQNPQKNPTKYVLESWSLSYQSSAQIFPNKLKEEIMNN